MNEQIQSRLVELEQQLERYIQQANLEIAYRKGQIEALKELLKGDLPATLSDEPRADLHPAEPNNGKERSGRHAPSGAGG